MYNPFFTSPGQFFLFSSLSSSLLFPPFSLLSHHFFFPFLPPQSPVGVLHYSRTRTVREKKKVKNSWFLCFKNSQSSELNLQYNSLRTVLRSNLSPHFAHCYQNVCNNWNAGVSRTSTVQNKASGLDHVGRNSTWLLVKSLQSSWESRLCFKKSDT